jgi:Flp pilus assembly protein CpaB
VVLVRSRVVRSRLPSTLPPIPWRPLVRRLRRTAAAWWIVAAAAAGLAGERALDAGRAAAEARAGWGESVVVAVAVHDLELGDVVASGDVDVIVEPRPRATVPAGALADVPVGRVIVAPVLAGEVLVDRRVAPDGLTGTAALVPAGHRAVAVPIDAGLGAVSPEVGVGDRVDVLATFDVTDGSEPPTGTVAAGVTVVAVADTSVSVSVPVDDAPRVAFAAARGTVALAIVGAD